MRIIEEGEAIDQTCKTQRAWAHVSKEEEAFAVYYAEVAVGFPELEFAW
jgi:hypothetical protein